MSLAEIKAKIESEAKSESQRIIDAAREEIVAIQKKTSDEIAKIESQYAERLKREEPEILRRREIVGHLDVQKIELGVKQELIDEAFVQALKTLQTLPQGKYLDFVKGLLRKAAGSGKGEVIIGSNEKFITEHAFDNPRFVEDVVRDIAERLSRDTNVRWFAIEAENFESIHNHSAYAYLERNKEGGNT